MNENLKLIKGNLKWWHQEQSQNMKGEILNVKEHIESIEVKGECVMLDELVKTRLF